MASTSGQMDANISWLLPSKAYKHTEDTNEVEDEGSMQFDFDQTATPSTRIRKIPTNFRRWEKVHTKGGGTPFRFKVASYNVLAQKLLECHPYLYTDCNPEDLTWHARSERLFKEITELDPDILCLQEVQATHIKTFFVKFEELGYYGIFKRRTNQRQDGCAIYFKKSVFELRDFLTVEYFQPGMPLLNRDNVGVILKLHPIGLSVGPLIVATTHLLYNPKREDVRLAQMQVLLAELDRFSYFKPGKMYDGGYYPIILTGDFNAVPWSPVVRLLDFGRVCTIDNRDHVDWRRLAITDNCQHLSVHVNRPLGIHSDNSMIKLRNHDFSASANVFPRRAHRAERHPAAVRSSAGALRNSSLFNRPMLRHKFTIDSVYPRIKHNRALEATTFQNGWLTVDYMYYSCESKLRLLRRLRLPTRHECEVLRRLPNRVFGSDHLMLAAEFEMHIRNIPLH